MAKKITIETLKTQLSELEGKEQTAEVMEQVDAVKAQIESFEAEQKAIADEIARNEADKAAKAKEKAEKKAGEKKGHFTTYEVWQLERKLTDGRLSFPRLKLKKVVKILEEHAQILNEQRENTLLEYVKKEV